MKLAIYSAQLRTLKFAQKVMDFINIALNDKFDLVLSYTTVNALLDHGIDTSSFSNLEYCDAKQICDGVDFIISLGGDGTFLKAAHWSGEKQIPIVGVNLGHLGYLTAFSLEDIEGIPAKLLKGDYDVESRSMLKVNIDGDIPVDGDLTYLHALNEVAVLKQDTASMISIPVAMDGKELGTYHADGLVISTPTGSTAYNLSIGGPVLQPTVHAFTLAPIADHSLTMRPMVINDDTKLEITALGRARSFRVSLDGNSFVLPVGTRITVEKAAFHCKMVCRKGAMFSSTLRSKLLWGTSRLP